MTTKEQISVMQAYLDGYEIEGHIIGEKDWVPCKRPDWNWGMCEYRIRQLPEYKLKRGKYNQISKLLEEGYDFDELEVQQVIMEVGEILGVTITVQ